MKKLISGLLSVLFLGPVCAFASGPVPGIFHRSPTPGSLYVIELEGLDNAEWHLATILQGMASREGPSIYLVKEDGDRILLSYYEKEYGIENLGKITVAQALEKYAGLFKGYALFSFEEGWTVNAADTFCSIRDCLPVTRAQEALAASAGLEEVADFRGRWKSGEESVKWCLEELFPECSKKMVGSVEPRIHNTRDYVFAHRIFTFYLVASGREYLSLRKLMQELPRNIPVIGYIARTGFEEWVVEYTLAEQSKFMVPTNTTPNLSVHSGIPMSPLPELEQWTEPPDIRGKLGVVFAFTDGDNLHLESRYYLRPDFWGHPCRGELKVAWSMAPGLFELAPGMLCYYYDTRTDKDFFVTLSGAGYTFPSSFADQDFFRSASIRYMELAGQHVLWNLDPMLYFAIGKRAIARLMDPMKSEHIKGLLAGYAPPVHMRDWIVPPGHPPVLFSRLNYYYASNELIVRMIKADAALVPCRGRVVFYGVTNWEISYDDLVEIKRRLDNRDDIVLLSPQEAFSIIKAWRDQPSR